MKPLTRLVAVVAGLVLPLHIPPSWGQPLVNPTVSSGNMNTGGGTGALSNVDETATGGVNNTAFGFDALAVTTTGQANTASGAEALFFNTTGGGNTATGFDALFFNATGNNNTATGADALFFNTTGSSNTASGVSALLSNTTGNGNTASGVNALFNNTTGNDNTAVGGGSLVGNSTGSKNTAIGVAALNQSTGNKNIGIGFQAGLTLTMGNNNIYIGNQGAGDEFQTIRIGTAQTQTFIAGITSGSVGNSSPVVIDTATGQLGIPSSSARYKRDIETMANRSEGLLKLRPVTFSYKDDASAAPHYGLIAEEVATVYPELVTRTASGEVQTVKYHELIPMLLNELQREHQAVATLHKELAELRSLLGSRPRQ